MSLAREGHHWVTQWCEAELAWPGVCCVGSGAHRSFSSPPRIPGSTLWPQPGLLSGQVISEFKERPFDR